MIAPYIPFAMCAEGKEADDADREPEEERGDLEERPGVGLDGRAIRSRWVG
jgi:hypothetical protein